MRSALLAWGRSIRTELRAHFNVIRRPLLVNLFELRLADWRGEFPDDPA
jgi:hypothetical protein